MYQSAAVLCLLSYLFGWFSCFSAAWGYVQQTSVSAAPMTIVLKLHFLLTVSVVYAMFSHGNNRCNAA